MNVLDSGKSTLQAEVNNINIDKTDIKIIFFMINLRVLPRHIFIFIVVGIVTPAKRKSHKARNKIHNIHITAFLNFVI